VGAAHASDWTDGLERIGSLIGAMLGFELWHNGGIRLYAAYSADQINNFYVIWALIDGCPILAERELRLYHLLGARLSEFSHDQFADIVLIRD